MLTIVIFIEYRNWNSAIKARIGIDAKIREIVECTDE